MKQLKAPKRRNEVDAEMEQKQDIQPQTKRRTTEVPGPEDILIDPSEEEEELRDDRIPSLVDSASIHGDVDYRVYAPEASTDPPPTTTTS